VYATLVAAAPTHWKIHFRLTIYSHDEIPYISSVGQIWEIMVHNMTVSAVHGCLENDAPNTPYQHAKIDENRRFYFIIMHRTKKSAYYKQQLFFKI
jgi:hypothetical protein